MKIKIKRVYENPDKEDGIRTLVDRLWLRGLTKEKESVELWLIDIAPSTKLQKWFGHDLERLKEFRKRYRHELKENEVQASLLKDQMKKEMVTLLYDENDEKHNQTVVLKELFSH
jgi:uncharacterized protein YeaO (DUF488 family)